MHTSPPPFSPHAQRARPPFDRVPDGTSTLDAAPPTKRACAPPYELVVRRMLPELLSIARVLLGSPTEAVEVARAAFSGLGPTHALVRDEPRLCAHLRRTAVRECLARRRARRTAPAAPVAALLPSFLPDGRHRQPARPWPMPTDADRRSECLRASIDELPPRHAEVLLLCDLLSFDTTEVAAVLGSDARTIRCTLHRAHQALRSLLESRPGVAVGGA
ncbi:MAG TPA: sigma-70 family RNA polymerase sigma factor [Planctomycetota bacterium]|nr:sigma-70 family RNA polymerase sigma factor [Planctomycetota bacterium]